MSEYGRPRQLTEEMAYQMGDGALVLVGGDGCGYATRSQFVKEIGDAGIDGGVLGAMHVIVFQKMMTHSLDHSCGAHILGQGAFQQLGDAIAYHVVVSRDRVGGIS